MNSRTLGGALAARIDDAPHASAIEHRGRIRRYAELSAAALAVADTLRRLGINRGAHVGVLADDGSLLVPAMLGILAHGAVFVLLEPTHPQVHLRRMVQVGNLACLLVEHSLTARVAEVCNGLPCRVEPIDADLYERGGSVSSLLAEATALPLYLCFSSGTTGRAKAILGRADSLLHFVDWEIATLGLDSAVRVSQLTSPGHDPYLRDVFTPLVAGGTVCIPDTRELVLSAVEFGSWLERSMVDVVHCTPTVFRNLCHGGLVGRNFERLKYVLLAGEPLRGAHVAAWYRAFGDRIQLINLYGPTETTLARLYYRVHPNDAGRAAIPIGQPMNDCRVRILASTSEECAPGEVGELHIETSYATLGYYGDRALTVEAFEPEPERACGRPVVYRSGDLVKRLPDGNIEFVARKDQQRKVRGKLVHLEDVEEQIVRHTGVTACVVSVLDGEGDRPDELVASYLGPLDLDVQAIRERLAQELPGAMIPDRWILVSSLPTDVNGKVDRHAAASSADPTPLATRNDSALENTEARLAALWKELLRRETVEPDDVFMNVGGDSLTIMLLIARLGDEYGYELTLWQVFDDLTIRKLAALIDNGAPRPSGEPSGRASGVS